jgi:hypothetical protein
MKYKWIAECNDGAFNDESALFDSEKECYNDMRNAVLEKMKWNTEFDDDFTDIQEDDYIGYEVHFSKREITHKSYSGLYTYKIVEVIEKKSFHVWQSFQGSICVDVMAVNEEEAYKIGSKMLEDLSPIDVADSANWDRVEVELN